MTIRDNDGFHTRLLHLEDEPDDFDDEDDFDGEDADDEDADDEEDEADDEDDDVETWQVANECARPKLRALLDFRF